MSCASRRQTGTYNRSCTSLERQHTRRTHAQNDQATHISWTLGGMDSQSEAAIGYVVWCCRARKMGSLLKSRARFFCVDGATEAAKQVC